MGKGGNESGRKRGFISTGKLWSEPRRSGGSFIRRFTRRRFSGVIETTNLAVRNPGSNMQNGGMTHSVPEARPSPTTCNEYR